MRIISGKYKGRKLDDKVPDGTRPTQDAVKETIFNILNNYIDFDGIAVMDVCAGTGSLGFEALSRGAEFCCFIDKNKASIKMIQSVATKLGLEDTEYDLILDDALRYLNTYKGPQFDLIMTDPPYAKNFLGTMLAIINDENIISANGIMVVEQSRESLLVLPEGWQELSQRQFGASKITFLQAPGEDD